ncbi:MAG: chaperonin GroEL [Candidatus Liptonbacteria bacterium]|nr:chaperonin GroEL [Candidatus Liptonbacteria bacterium]
MAKQILFDKEARAALKKGIDKLADAVRVTLGPRGRAVVIDKGYGSPQVTFDGVTVAKEVELKDKYENLGAEFLKQAADKTNDKVGDGTTTSVVLAHAMIEEGEKVINKKGFNVIQLSEELNKVSQKIIIGLEKQKELIDDNKKVEEVATLASKDKEVGALIAEVMQKITKEGVVTIEDSNTIGNSYEIVEGLQFDRGYISPYMINNPERAETILDNPYVLITDQKISSINDLLPLLEKLIQSGKKELAIIADDIEGEALATLVINKLRGVFSVLAVKAPGFGDKRKEMLQDIAIVTGAELISEELGRKLTNTDVTSLGQCHRIISSKDNTTIVGGTGNKIEIEKRIVQIKSQISKIESEYEKEKLQERLGKLSGGVAVIKVGAPTESAQKDLKHRVEDAIAATKAAMEEGIVPGGGIALFNAYNSIENIEKTEETEISKAVLDILKRAVESPAKAIIANSGEDSEKMLQKIIEEQNKTNNPWIGFNALVNKINDLKEAGIIDPLKVVKTAFINAVSVAATYLVIGAALTEIPEEKGKEGGHMRDMSADY